LAEERGLFDELMEKKKRIKILLAKEKNQGRKLHSENKVLHEELRQLQVS
jgi:hypothetical protein